MISALSMKMRLGIGMCATLLALLPARATAQSTPPNTPNPNDLRAAGATLIVAFGVIATAANAEIESQNRCTGYANALLVLRAHALLRKSFNARDVLEDVDATIEAVDGEINSACLPFLNDPSPVVITIPNVSLGPGGGGETSDILVQLTAPMFAYLLMTDEQRQVFKEHLSQADQFALQSWLFAHQTEAAGITLEFDQELDLDLEIPSAPEAMPLWSVPSLPLPNVGEPLFQVPGTPFGTDFNTPLLEDLMNTSGLLNFGQP